MHTICSRTFTHMPTYMHNTQKHENGKRLKEEEKMMMMKMKAVAMAEKRWPVCACVWGVGRRVWRREVSGVRSAVRSQCMRV